MVHVNITEKHLPGSSAELFVCDHLKKARKWQIEFHNVRVQGVQVDILARTPEGLLTLIEVKSQTKSGCAHVSTRQMFRLMKVGEFLAEYEPIEMNLALVHDNAIQILPVDGLTAFRDMGNWRR